MINLKTKYLGLELKNPLVAGASPLSRDVGTARSLEDAGVAAIVMSRTLVVCAISNSSRALSCVKMTSSVALAFWRMRMYPAPSSK